MNKNKMLKIINTVLAVLFLTQVLSGFLHDYIPGDIFEIVHEGGAVLLVFFLGLHIYLNWGWVKSSFFKKS